MISSPKKLNYKRYKLHKLARDTLRHRKNESLNAILRKEDIFTKKYLEVRETVFNLISSKNDLYIVNEFKGNLFLR